MKVCVRLLLVAFLTFLSTPTIVSLIEKSCDTSIYYTMSEEEETGKLKLMIAEDPAVSIEPVSFWVSSRIVFENMSRHDNVSSSVFSPPPENV